MTRKELHQILRNGRIVSMTLGDWEKLAGDFEVMEEHDTGFAGKLLLVQGKNGLAAVEAPERKLRILRPLPDMETAREFIQDRMETYDRMWDGCGCKIDYLH